jgi:hypothetical protein
MTRQISHWVNVASPVTMTSFNGSPFDNCKAVISFASGSIRNWPITPSSDALNATTRCAPGDNAVALPRYRLPSIATCPAGLAALNPGAQYALQTGEIEALEQFTPHGKHRNPAAADPNAGQRLATQLFAPTA